MKQVPAAVVASALAGAAHHGDFFALPVAPAPDLAAVVWRPFTDLTTSAPSKPLRAVLEGLAGRLGTEVSRPVASLLHLAVAARLCLPPLATAARSGVVPVLSEQALRYSCDSSGRFLVALAEPPPGSAGTINECSGRLLEEVAHGPLAALTGAVNRLVPLPRHTTNGNVASALAAGAQRLGADRPTTEEGARAYELLSRVLAHEPLDRAGHLAPMSAAAGTAFFRRGNCCLFFQLPGGGTCGDCILTGRRRRQHPGDEPT